MDLLKEGHAAAKLSPLPHRVDESNPLSSTRRALSFNSNIGHLSQ